MDGYLFLEFGGKNVEEAVADLSLCNKGRDVINFKLGSCKFVIHLLHAFLQFFGELLAFLQCIDLLFMFVEDLSKFLYFHRLLSMHLAMVLQNRLHIFDIHIDIANALVDEKTLLF